MSDLSPAKLIRAAFPALELAENVPLSEHCSFRIGGPAEVFVQVNEEATLLALTVFLREHKIPLFLLGNGTNLLVRDEGVRGVVLRLGGNFARVERCGSELVAGAAITLARLAVFAKNEGLDGLVFAHGIPGSLGGAIVMNAGAYGGEMKDVVVSVRALGPDGVIREYSGEECGFAYRHSRFETSGEIILSARLALSPADSEVIAAGMRELQQKRAGSQPLDKASAGSTFKRPQVGYAAAMIDQAGLKGFTLGGAQVSEKHAGFVINCGGASCADVLALMEHIRGAVRERFGVELEPEVRIVG